MKFLNLLIHFRKYIVGHIIVLLCTSYPIWAIAVPPWVYVTNNRSNSMTIIDSAKDTVIATIPVGKEPHEIAITPNGNRVLVCNAQDNTVSVIDSNIEVATIPTERYPHGVAITPNGKKAYVVNFMADSVTVIDVQSTKVLETLHNVHANPRNISITPDGRYAYITTMGTSTVTALDLSSHKIIAQIP
ncbi:MAG: beta-propeller fold lactonase family protein, partial [Desulfobacterales bacterium]|nr:beta-propeller fold lactonase family protein [Desulfobacterales bacterium]